MNVMFPPMPIAVRWTFCGCRPVWPQTQTLGAQYNATTEVPMTDDPKGPIEDDLEDPANQDPSPDLPSPLEGDLSEDDMDDDET